MASRPDPLAYAADESRDLQGIATWEPRSILDKALARYTATTIRAVVVLFGLLILAGASLLWLFAIIVNPFSLLFVVLFPFSVLPALLLAGYVWYTDITREPWLLLIATYLLGIILAGFPYLVNTVVGLFVINSIAGLEVPLLTYGAQVVNFFVVVAPLEEGVKLGAVFMYVYWKEEFDTVVDGAVYGAIAGLGFATIENMSYIIFGLAETSNLLELVIGGSLLTFGRSLAGPGHVIWTGIAGYYLGLAKFNRDYALPLIVKGLLVAIVLHATYNSMLATISGVFSFLGLALLGIPVLFGFIIVYHVFGFGYLFWKLRRYRKTYAKVSPGEHAAPVAELDGYDEAGRE